MSKESGIVSVAPITDSARRFFGSVRDVFISGNFSSLSKTGKSNAQGRHLFFPSPISKSSPASDFTTSPDPHHLEPQPESSLRFSFSGNRNKLQKRSFNQCGSSLAVNTGPSSPISDTSRQLSMQISLTYPRYQRLENMLSISSETPNPQYRTYPLRSSLRLPLPRPLTPLGVPLLVQKNTEIILKNKPSWTHPFPNSSAELKRRSTLIRERLLGGSLRGERQFRPKTRTNDAYLDEGMTERGPQIGTKQREHGIGIELMKRLTAKVPRWRQQEQCGESDEGIESFENIPTASSYYSLIQGHSVDIESDCDGVNVLRPMDTELSDLVEQSVPLSASDSTDLKGNNVLSSTVISKSLASPLEEMLEGDFDRESQVDIGVDFDSDEYFFDKLKCLEEDVALHGKSILQSKYFSEALRINYMDPKLIEDTDVEVLQRKVWSLTM